MELSKHTKIKLCTDGKYRWIYELDMLRNPVIFSTVIAVLGLGFCSSFLLVTVLDIVEGHFSFDNLKVLGILCSVLIVICLLSYLIVAKVYGYKYIVVFEMDEEGINHIQKDSQADKARILSGIVALSGTATKNPGVAGAGLLAYSKTHMYTAFSKVRKIVPNRRFNYIKLNERLFRNQVYCDEADFDFVYNYIKQRCGK